MPNPLNAGTWNIVSKLHQIQGEQNCVLTNLGKRKGKGNKPISSKQQSYSH